jgi:hypothetical protein
MFSILFLTVLAMVAVVAISAALVQFRRDGYRRTPTVLG